MKEKWILGLTQCQLAAAPGLRSRTPDFGSGVVLPLLTLLYVLDICKHETEIDFVCIIWVPFRAMSCWNSTIWNWGRARYYNFKSKGQLTWRLSSPWHKLLKLMVHSVYLFLQMLRITWFFPVRRELWFLSYVTSSRCFLLSLLMI